MNKNTYITIAIVCVFAVALTGIFLYAKRSAAPVPPVVETGEEGVLAAYTDESWKTMIPESCLSYYDGCNTCTRVKGQASASCTERYCTVYSKPRCLDQDSGPYTSESWKTIIDQNCRTFNDGCNTCTRMDDGGAACTRMMCQAYARPECLDAKG